MSKWNNGASWAAAMALAVGLASGASAADLGGNCCADLEERIAELEATTARKGNRKVSLEISGWVNKTVLFWDDSVSRDFYAGIDNDAAASRWRFVGAASITPDVTAGFQYEISAVLGLTSSVDQSNGGDDRGYFNAGGTSGLNTILRQANVWVQSKRLGKITLGYASQATDGIAEIDLSRTEAVSGSSVDTWIANFVDVINGSYTTGANRIMYFHFLGNFDGGRDQLIRYDSPMLAGFQFSASLSGGSIYPFETVGTAPPFVEKKKEWDVALRYAAEWNGVRFAAGVGYHVGIIADGIELISGLGGRDRMPYNEKFVGSASMLHVPTGLFLSMAAGQMNNLDNFLWPEGDTNKYIYAKTGLQRNFTGFGDTVLYGEYYRIEKDVVEANCGIGQCWTPGVDATSTMWGVGVVQHIDAAAMEIYAAYRFYDAPNGSNAFAPAVRGDFNMGQIGMRIKF